MSGPHKRPAWHDAYDMQMALWRWYRTDQAQRWMRTSYDINARDLRGDTVRLLREMYLAELSRLLECDPLYVSRDMCELVAAAAETFQPEPLLESDVLTPRGFLYFAEPFPVQDRFDTPTTIAAASWSRTWSIDDKQGATERLEQVLDARVTGELEDGTRLGWDQIEDEMEAAGAEASGLSLTLYAITKPSSVAKIGGVGAYPPLLPLHITPWWFGMTFDGNEVDELGQPTGAAWWWRILQTTFRLMQQPLAHRTLVPLDRGGRREAKRWKARPDTEIVVVRLRREEGDHIHGDDHGTANYSHRFIRSGHWRNQWYPSIKSHRQIWIAPTVVGDPSLPLIVRPRRVYQWTR